MRRVLYLVSSKSEPLDLIPPPGAPGIAASIVLLEEAVTRPDVSADHVFVLRDADESRADLRYPSITSQDLVRMIFEADSVVAL